MKAKKPIGFLLTLLLIVLSFPAYQSNEAKPSESGFFNFQKHSET